MANSTEVDPGDDILASDYNNLREDAAIGWFSAGETWTYASADTPTFTFTIPGDKTSKYSPGMRIKLTQTTVKYFIITAVAYSAPNTTITIYGGTDYTLVGAAITEPFFSAQKAPIAFPLDPSKWTVKVTDSIQRQQLNPTNGTWYNLGDIQITIPLGLWSVEYFVCLGVKKEAATEITAYVTLSTTNSSESDTDMTASEFLDGASGTLSLQTCVYRRKIITALAKSIYYINTKTLTGGVLTITNHNVNSKLIIRAVCAYL